MKPRPRELADVIPIELGRRRSKRLKKDAGAVLDARFELRSFASEKDRWTLVAAQRGYLALSDWARDVLNRAAKLQALTSSDDETINTPPVVLRALEPLGVIALDPCSNESSIVPALRSFRLDEGQDGLALPWHRGRDGYNYVNPPYGRELPKWIAKAIREAHFGAEIVMLVPARPDAAWYDRARKDGQARADWRGRLKFLGKGSAPFPSSIFYWGPRVDVFAPALRKFAHVEVAA